MVEERSQTKNESTIEALAERHVELKQLRSSIDEAIKKHKATMKGEEERINKLMEEWTSFGRAHSTNADRVRFSLLFNYVLLTEKCFYGLDVINMESTFELMYFTFGSIYALIDGIAKQFAKTMTKEEAQEFVEQQAANFSRNMLRTIQQREERAKRRWINGKLGKGAPK